VDSREGESDSDTHAADVNAWRQAYILPLRGQLHCAAKRCRFIAPVLERTEAIAEQGAAPNGGPAASVVNLNAPGGPPSVS